MNILLFDLGRNRFKWTTYCWTAIVSNCWNIVNLCKDFYYYYYHFVSTIGNKLFQLIDCKYKPKILTILYKEWYKMPIYVNIPKAETVTTTKDELELFYN